MEKNIRDISSEEKLDEGLFGQNFFKVLVMTLKVTQNLR